MRLEFLCGVLLGLAAITAEAKVLEVIPSSTTKVALEFPGSGDNPPGQLAKAVVYMDGPVLRWRGEWKHPNDIQDVSDPVSPVPELLAPVRIVLPGVHKLFDIDDRMTTHGEVRPETFTPESRIFRVLLPITSIKRAYRYEVLFHAGLKVPMNITVEFKPPQGIVIRNGECVRQGVTMDLAVLGNRVVKKDGKTKEVDPDTIDPTLIYLFCATESDEIQTAIYAPLDRTWRKYGLAARKVYLDRGLFFAIPRPERGVVAPETVTEFELEKANGSIGTYELRYNPPYRPRLAFLHFMTGPSYHHYSENRDELDVDEIAWFGRLSMGAKLLPEGFDVYADVGGTMSALDHGPSVKLAKFEYWFMNARLGYVPRVVPGEAEWSVMAGWYWWRFYVDAKQYGVTDKLGGPQLFLQKRFQPQQGRAWWLNARIVFVSDLEYPRDFRNHELSLGGGIDIAWVGKRRPLALTADLARVQFSKTDNTMRIFTFVLGVSFPIY